MISVPIFTKDKAGALYLNDAAIDVGGGVLAPQQIQNPLTVPAASSASQPGGATTVLESPTDSYQEILSLIANLDVTQNVNKRLLVEMVDYAHSQRALTNRPVPALHVFGTQKNPFFLDDEYTQSIFLNPQQILKFIFTNPLIGTDAVISFLAESTKIKNRAVESNRELMKQVKNLAFRTRQLLPFWFAPETNLDGSKIIPGVTLPANASRNLTFYNRRNDLTLILNTILAHPGNFSDATGDLRGIAGYEIFTPYDDQPLQNQPVAMDCGAGNPAFPYRMSTPLIIGPNESFTVTLSSYVNVSVDWFFTFHGLGLDSKHGDPGEWNTSGGYQSYPEPALLRSIE